MKTPKFITPLDINLEREAIIEEFKAKSGKLDYIPLIGDDYMTLIDIFLFRINNFIELLNFKISQNYLNFSSGDYLDELVALIGIKRNEEIKPIATLKISVSSPAFLPKGSKFIDGEGHSAYLMADANIEDEAEVKIEAEGYFKENYQTTRLEVSNIYVKDISITSPFSGFKARESDEELRDRFLLALHRFSTAGSAKSYLFYILSVEGIKKASVYNLSPGVVQIVYFSKFDEQTAIQKINEALDGRVPLTDTVKIKPATKIPLDLVIHISLEKEFLYPQVVKSADERIRRYFDDIKIGFTPHVSKIIDVAFDDDLLSVEVKRQIPTIARDEILALNSLKILKADNA